MPTFTAPIYLKDYQAPAFIVGKASLVFKLFADHTQVDSVLTVSRGPHYKPGDALRLDGEHLTLVRVAVDGRELSDGEYTVEPDALIIPDVPAKCDVAITVTIKPQENTALTGLYASQKAYCTQCESHGFRRITYFIDRPDNLSLFHVRIEADKKQYPHLLSNGNPIEQGALDNGRHFVTWEDPFKKPCYLFALVAGDFYVQEDEFITCTGRRVALRIYAEKHNEGKTAFAMYSLKEAMRWDEEVYGREYDLDIYMIVAVSDFNMGAMENKGLNIFNDKCILANPDVATDRDYHTILRVVAHEYFHNWSGNRVTLRDWFQLSLKEGFTVFRDQSFGADMGSAGVERIEEMGTIQTSQFAEDASPMSHPVRPASYIEMNNFYTVTVYEKGAEVIRMLHTLLGPERFRTACDDYFDRFDGSAVTTDDFVDAMQSETDIDLTQFRRWYSQSGTPEVSVRFEHDESSRSLVLDFTQLTPPTPDQQEKLALHIPIRMALLNQEGALIPFALPGTDKAMEQVYSLTQANATLRIEDVDGKVIPSLFRGFSAPVKVKVHNTPDEWFFLATHDTDPCARTQAFNRLCLHECFETIDMGSALEPKRLALFMAAVLQSEMQDYAMMAHLLTLPSDMFFAEARSPVNVEGIVAWRMQTKQYLARTLYDSFKQYYLALEESDSEYSSKAAGKRALRQVCLQYLVASGEVEGVMLAAAQYNAHKNMTETMGALYALRDAKNDVREMCLQDFYERWKDNSLVMDKWFAMQAQANRDDAVFTSERLAQHPAFNIKNPNKVYSLFAAFGYGNFAQFHRADGEGYAFIRDAVIALDKINPQVAARVITPLIQYRRYDEQRAALMKQALVKISASSGISKDIYEIVTKSI
ncbi:MAG: aminopeptidase N [Gammaproteobacteria bacterium]